MIYIGSFEVIVFESIYNKCINSLIEENIVFIDGRLSIREDEPTKIIASNIREIVPDGDFYKKVVVDITNFSDEKKQALRNFIRTYSKNNNSKTEFYVKVDKEERNCGKIYMDEEIKCRLYMTFGEENIGID